MSITEQQKTDKTDKENINQKSSNNIIGIIHLIFCLFAIYLSFKCNNGFDLGSFLMAILFPYIYIIYKFATDTKLCGIKN